MACSLQGRATGSRADRVSGMALMIVLCGVVLIAAASVFYSEQVDPPRDVIDLSPGAFLFGLLVRIALTIVMLSMSAMLIASIWTRA